ncbi:MAG TPA: hypothetical protein PKE29_06810 [Phycisphaerales bacterium]|nr:hypothetical protein [Phycisphaerales bacterium]
MMFRSSSVGSVLVCATGALGLAVAESASAGTWVSASDPFISIRADAGPYQGVFNVPLSAATEFHDPDPLSGGDLWGWTAASNTPIMDGAHTVALLVDMNVFAARLPVLDSLSNPTGQFRWGISMSYNVQAGSDATTFTLCSPELLFGPISNAYGTASATMGGTSQPNGSSSYDGISINPALPSGLGFAALFNGSPTFRDYFASPLTNVGSGSVGAAGNMTVPGVDEFVADPVSSIQSKYKFTLSAFDTSAGTSDYSITPAPGAAALFGLAGLIGLRRKR